MDSQAEIRSDTARGNAAKVAGILPSMRWLFAMLVPLAAFKGAQVFIAPPTADEAYYWLWGQHLALSYYDHPPLAAWLQRLSAELFGWNLFALRAAPLASFAGCLWILWFWAKRLAGQEHAMRAFLAGTVAWLSMPMLMRFQSIAHQDHLLVFFGIATAHFWALFLSGHEAGRRAWRYYYAGCIALGLAGLSKYNAVFIGLGFAAWALFSARGRRLLASPHPWIGAAIAVAMQAPVIAWNVEQGWPSFRYNLDERIGYSNFDSPAGNLGIFLYSSLLMLSPVMAVGLARFVTGGGLIRTSFESVGRAVFTVSTLITIALCLSNTVLHYWNLPAYLFLLPAAVFYLRSRMEFTLHALYGILMAIWFVGMHAIYPVYKVNGGDLRDNDISFGLDEIAAIVEEEEARLGADMVMTTDYRTASLLSFAAKRLDIEKIGRRRDQFDFWFDPSAHKGQNALVLVDDYLPEQELVTEVFEKVTPIREFTIRRHGLDIHTYRLVWAENYSGSGPH
ncbi:ArnT family glycosyltransferase [Oricola thermophila]|uniref:Glycosyltransferase family 39 protein n=1 Tax=Oricola thermophila TaxID=2742145 RepID=A0A6N1V8A4_9HYPH|nr:glycosyltransferase family 39 protein [Oricola thermophila]QKV17140.1 glycosyltransferase family 39 protein [Oricola thermophila]